MPFIGFGTGCLYKKDFSNVEKAKLYLKLGANAIELNVATIELVDKLLQELNQDNQLLETLHQFDYVAIHAPRIGVEYGDNKTSNDIIKKLKIIHEMINSAGIVIHAYVIKDLDYLQKTMLPFLIYNIGKKNRGSNSAYPEYFEHLNQKYNFNYILDLQHVYELLEEDQELHNKLTKAMGSKLKHIHIAGVNKDEDHALIYDSDNKDIMSKWLKDYKNKPIILEGVINEKIDNALIEDMLQKEISYIKNLVS